MALFPSRKLPSINFQLAIHLSSSAFWMTFPFSAIQVCALIILCAPPILIEQINCPFTIVLLFRSSVSKSNCATDQSLPLSFARVSLHVIPTCVALSEVAQARTNSKAKSIPAQVHIERVSAISGYNPQAKSFNWKRQPLKVADCCAVSCGHCHSIWRKRSVPSLSARR